MRFPSNKVGKMIQLTVIDNTTKSQVDIKYQDLQLVVIGGQLCFKYESPDGDLYMAIARVGTVKRLMQTGNEEVETASSPVTTEESNAKPD
jgi:hypothetical protein